MCQVKIATNLPQNLAKELMTRIASPTNPKAAFKTISAQQVIDSAKSIGGPIDIVKFSDYVNHNVITPKLT